MVESFAHGDYEVPRLDDELKKWESERGKRMVKYDAQRQTDSLVMVSYMRNAILNIKKAVLQAQFMQEWNSDTGSSRNYALYKQLKQHLDLNHI